MRVSHVVVVVPIAVPCFPLAGLSLTEKRLLRWFHQLLKQRANYVAAALAAVTNVHDILILREHTKPLQNIPFPLYVRMYPVPCSQTGTEEVTVPLVLSRLFHQILPSLEPVLAQRGGASATATGFR